MRNFAIASLAASVMMSTMGFASAMASSIGFKPGERTWNPSRKQQRAKDAADQDPYYEIATSGRRGAFLRFREQQTALACRKPQSMRRKVGNTFLASSR